MLDNAIQHYWKLVVERLYCIVPCIGGRIYFAEGEKVFIKNVELTDRNQQVMMCMRTLLEHFWKNTVVGCVLN